MLRSPNSTANQIHHSYKNDEFDWPFDFEHFRYIEMTTNSLQKPEVIMVYCTKSLDCNY